MSTYKTAVEDLKVQIAKCNQTANFLRDRATPEEKKYWNNTRMNLFEVEKQLNALLENLTPLQANKELA